MDRGKHHAHSASGSAIATAIAHFDGSWRAQQFVRCAFRLPSLFNCDSALYRPNVEGEDRYLCVVQNRLKLERRSTSSSAFSLKRKRPPSASGDAADVETGPNKRPKI
jgi:hypothetical protein